MASVSATGTNAASADLMVPELVRRLEGAPAVLRSALGDLGRELEVDAKRTIKQQLTAYGEPWPLTKEGKPALVNAAAWLTSRVKGSSVRLVVRGYMGLHDLGRARGRVQRKMLPTVEGGIPPAWVATIDRVVRYHLVKALSV